MLSVYTKNAFMHTHLDGTQEQINVMDNALREMGYRDVDGPRDCHTAWSKSEREKQISYINAYLWNLEKWYRWTGLQGRNRDTDVENKRMDMKGGKRGFGGWDELGDRDCHIYTNMYKIDN